MGTVHVELPETSTTATTDTKGKASGQYLFLSFPLLTLTEVGTSMFGFAGLPCPTHSFEATYILVSRVVYLALEVDGLTGPVPLALGSRGSSSSLRRLNPYELMLSGYSAVAKWSSYDMRKLSHIFECMRLSRRQDMRTSNISLSC
jgi:hypothetical protein